MCKSVCVSLCVHVVRCACPYMRVWVCMFTHPWVRVCESAGLGVQVFVVH